MRGKKYNKFHNVLTHSTVNCIKLKDQIQDSINEGKIQFETATSVNVAMVDFSPEKRNRRRPTLGLLLTKAGEEEELTLKKAKSTPKASAIVLCSKCMVECEILVSYDELENSFKFHPKANPVLRSPRENFQLASHKHIRSQ